MFGSFLDLRKYTLIRTFQVGGEIPVDGGGGSLGVMGGLIDFQAELSGGGPSQNSSSHHSHSSHHSSHHSRSAVADLERKLSFTDQVRKHIFLT